MKKGRERAVDLVLGLLAVTDLVLASWALIFPALWMGVIHGIESEDPEGFVRRCGANWAAFLVLQVIALKRWKRDHAWIAIVAGLRLGDVLTDWTYLAFARDLTLFGKFALGVASPLNLLAGLWLFRAFKSFTNSLITD